MINEERHKIELKTSEYNNIKKREQELADKEKEINYRQDALSSEMKNFFILKNENEKTKGYIDEKINE